MSFIGHQIMCENHKKSISLLNFTQGLPNEKRLYCVNCNLQQQSNLFSLDLIFEFALSVKKSQEQNIDMLKQQKETLNLIKNLIKQIEEQFNKLELEHKQIYDQVIQNQVIKPNDPLDICLQKKKQCNRDELIQMAVQTSIIMKQNCGGELQLSQNNSIQYFQKLEALGLQIKNLQMFLSQGQVIEQQYIPNNPPIQQEKVNEQQGFIPIAETQLEQTKIYDIKFNRENNLFIVGSSKLKNSNCYAQIWKFENKEISKIQDLENSHSGDVKCVCFSTSDDSFFTGSQDNTIIYWKLEPQQWVKDQVLDGQPNGIIGLQLNNKGNLLAAISNQIHLWKRDFGKWEKGQVLNQSKKQFLCLSFSSDDSYLAAGSSDCQIYIYQYLNDQWSLKNTIIDQSQEVNFISFVQDLNFMAILKDNNMNFYEYSKNNSYDQKQIQTLSSFQIAYSKKAKVLAVSSGRSKETSIYQIIQKKEGFKRVHDIQVKSEQVYSSNDGKIIAIIANQKLAFYSDSNFQY